MIRRLPVSAVFAAVALAVATPSAVQAQEGRQSIQPKFTIDYIEPRDTERLGPVMVDLMAANTLENFGAAIDFLKVPIKLRLKAQQCGAVNAMYRGDERSITLCYELVKDFIEKAPQEPFLGVSGDAIGAGSITSVMLHELGHALFDLLDVPVIGREEDAADQLAALILLALNKDMARQAIMGMAYYHQLDPDPQVPIAYADEHGTASQRFYNTLCMAYGADAEAFQEFVDRGMLPRARAASCQREYLQVQIAFAKTIAPHFDPAKMPATAAAAAPAP